MTTHLLHVEGLTKTYRSRIGEVHALRDVSFDLERGGSLGLVGESGSGKSTTARLILRLEQPTAGSVVFNGQDVFAASGPMLRVMRRNLQPVFQDPVASLNRRKSVEQIIAAPLVAYREGDRVTRRRRVDELLELVGLDSSFAHRRAHELSGGQAQRVGIARALALQPRLLILDEAVSALDVSVQAQILNLLRSLRDELDLTYLFISHDLAVVRFMCESIVVLYQGRVVEHAERDALFSSPQHPYTAELLRASVHDAAIAPVASSVGGGATPSATGCAYQELCPIDRDAGRCQAETPELRSIGAHHRVACHFRPTPAPTTPTNVATTSIDPEESSSS